MNQFNTNKYSYHLPASIACSMYVNNYVCSYLVTYDMDSYVFYICMYMYIYIYVAMCIL